MKKFTLFIVFILAAGSIFASIIWSVLLQDQRWFSRMAVGAVLFAAVGIMIRLDEIIEIIKQKAP